MRRVLNNVGRTLGISLLVALLFTNAIAQETSARDVIEGEREEALAPDEPGVLFSYLDNNLAPYLSHVELIDVAVFERCLAEGLTDCERGGGNAGIYRLPLVRNEDAERARAAIDTAWQAFYDKTVAKIHQTINGLPPCWNPLAPCGAHINWGCVFERQLQGVAEAFAEYQPEYWQAVVAALFDHVPLSLWWEGPFPLQEGAVVTAITSLEPRPGQISKLFKEPRDPSYHGQPYTAGVPLPYTPDELALPLYPGLKDKEIAKGGNVGQGLAPATVPEYTQFGYASFFEVWGGFEDTWFGQWWGLLYAPSIVGSICLIPYPPFVAIIPFIPVPTFVPQVPRAFYGEVSVPEGYALPRLAGSPLWTLPDIDAVLPASPTSLPAQPKPASRAIPAPIPCLPEGASWPPPGYEASNLGPPPSSSCPPGTLLPSAYGDPEHGRYGR